MARPRSPKPKRPPRALRAECCSEEAADIAGDTGLGVVEVENLLRAGRTRDELMILADGKRRR
jgi:hypothetical protein